VLSVQVLPRRGVMLSAALATIEIMTVMVAAHTWAGRELPGAGWMAAAAVLVFAVGTVALRSKVPLRALVPALVLAQFLLHCWMVVLAPATPATAHGHGPHLELTWRMVLAHLVGGLVTALVWQLRRRAVELVLSWAEPGLVPVPTRLRTVTPEAPVVPLRRPLVVASLRGPPVRRRIAA